MLFTSVLLNSLALMQPTISGVHHESTGGKKLHYIVEVIIQGFEATTATHLPWLSSVLRLDLHFTIDQVFRAQF